MERENLEMGPRPRRGKPREKTTPARNALYYLHDLSYMLATVLVVMLVFFRIVVVSGPSMYNTLVDGDYLILLSHVFYPQPKQGDIVVASLEDFKDGELIVKRVIATEGQTIRIDDETGIVYVDDVALEEPYTYSKTTSGMLSEPITVEKGCVFLMGDNRWVSQDSRDPAIGQVDVRNIVGRVLFLVFPGTDHGYEEWDFSRIGPLQ